MESKIVNLIAAIRECPGIYIGTKSLKLLHLFILGYIYAMKQEGIDCGKEIFYSFNEWHAAKYNIKKVVLWDDYLPDVCDKSNDPFDLFFEEFFYYVENVYGK